MSKYSKEIIIKIREEYLSGNLSEMELCNFYPDVTGEKMSFEAPLPADFRAIIDQLQPV